MGTSFPRIKMIKNVLITGGSGFIGSALALKPIHKVYNVTVLDNLSEQVHGNDPDKTSSLYRSVKGKVNFIRDSVTSLECWREAIIGQDAIFHMAAETGTGQSMYEIQRYIDVNIGGTGIMLNNMLGEQDLNPQGFHKWNNSMRLPTMISPTIIMKKKNHIFLNNLVK